MERGPIPAQEISYIVPDGTPQEGVFSSEALEEAPTEVHAVAASEQAEAIIALPAAAAHTEMAPVPPRKLLHKIGLGVASVTAIGVALSGGLILPGATSANDAPRPASERYPNTPFPEGQTKAVPVSPDALGMVDFLLAQPENPQVTSLERIISDRIKAVTGTAELSDRNTVETIKDEENFKVRQPAARKLDLHVFDPTATKKVLRENLDPAKPGVLPPAKYIAVANEFLAKEDVQLAVDPTVTYVEGKQYARNKTLNTRQSREFVLTFVDNIASQPKEYADALGIKRYLLTEPIPKVEQKAAAYIFANFGGPEGEAVVMDITTMYGAVVNDDTNHEQGHRLDYLTEGGGGSSDPGFEAAATKIPYGAAGKEPGKGKPDNRPSVAEKAGYYTLDRYEDEKRRASYEMSPHYEASDCLAVAEKLEKRMDTIGKKTVLTTTYAGKANVDERKAEGIRDIAQGDNYPRVLNAQTPHIRDQFRYLLANLYQYRPRLVRYFIDMSRRPNPDMNPYQNNPHYMSENCTYVATHPNETHGK